MSRWRSRLEGRQGIGYPSQWWEGVGSEIRMRHKLAWSDWGERSPCPVPI